MGEAGRVLDDEQVERFVAEGLVVLEGAFEPELAARGAEVLCAQAGIDPDDPSTWRQPVVRVPGSAAPPLVTAINTPRLTGAIDDLVGPGRWARRVGYGTFPIRLPSEVDPGDTGWHLDASFPVPGHPPPFDHGVNLWSRGRALLLLMCFTDVGADDAPTRVAVGSHRLVAPTLAPMGEAGRGLLDVMAGLAEGPGPVDPDALPERRLTAAAGDVALCHPFLLHAATSPHRGTRPRVLGQPAILFDAAHDGYRYDRPVADRSPCERAVVEALTEAGLPVPATPG